MLIGSRLMSHYWLVFCAFLDSSPDRWGRVLMQRRAAIEGRLGVRSSSRLTELDYLLGAHDSYRMGGIRF